MPALNSILSSFECLNLTEIGRVKLMERCETKFACHMDMIPDLLLSLSASYKTLAVNSKNLCRYNTLYYDTPDFDLFHKHLTGRTNRHKIRVRHYAESGTAYLEIKFKNNRGQSLKKRIVQNSAEFTWDKRNSDFVKNQSPYAPLNLEPKLWVDFDRITLVENQFNERVTIDTGIGFRQQGNGPALKNLAIIEIKQSKLAQSPMADVLRKLKIKPVSLSKYCLGVSLGFPNLKNNNFKPNLTTLNKLVNDHSFELAADY